MNRFFAGIDVGSTTIKAVVTNAADGEIVWKDYRRHETRQPETLLDFLRRMEAETGIAPDNCRVFLTGSGGPMFADVIGAKFVQEVLAASLAVERRHPEASAIVEIGGQDAKIVVLRRENGTIKKFPSMNDKCAGGTGAVIDKISKKLGIPLDDISGLHYDGIRLHQVAGKCGVFAETDINGLQKRGVPPRELMASLFEAFVLQNLQVLARGHTLLPHIILLGGPNAFIPGMREAWRRNISLMWRERGVEIPENARTEDLVYAPPIAEYYGAIGAIEYGREEELEVGAYRGSGKL
ncbi:MAG: CoA activase, partial [Acidobacteria bacterium]|nr:CoA activase [Acidobacteriota bacterium]